MNYPRIINNEEEDSEDSFEKEFINNDDDIFFDPEGMISQERLNVCDNFATNHLKYDEYWEISLSKDNGFYIEASTLRSERICFFEIYLQTL